MRVLDEADVICCERKFLSLRLIHAAVRTASLESRAATSCSTLPVFASSPLRGEDNDGIAQRCLREVGVIFG
jgi:hypothetical protein